MPEVSRRSVLGAAAGTAATAAFLTTAGPAEAADTAAGPGGDTLRAADQEGDTVMAVTTEEQKYEAYVRNEDGENLVAATFPSHSDPGDMWAFVDAALVRLRAQYPSRTFTANVQRYEQVVTDIAHP
ncbi:hypothetical protein ACFV6E_41150 [Streptomyces sp. NPDC059785]|uniref:hypothetical protein n=1 Tax=unclassified Streptomyces TaxID=2593676 RepID=UPI003663919D